MIPKLKFGDPASIEWLNRYQRYEGNERMRWLHGGTANQNCKDCIHRLPPGRSGGESSSCELVELPTKKGRRVLLHDPACGKFEPIAGPEPPSSPTHD